LLRINPDGSIPADNPFYDGDGPNLDEIWALGLRNPYRISVDPVTGRLFIGDVGANDNATSIEEINLGARGANAAQAAAAISPRLLIERDPGRKSSWVYRRTLSAGATFFSAIAVR